MASSFTPQQIEQFLQEFFDVVGARQYVGARYVPIFGRAGEDTVEWDDHAPYEPLTVVMHDGVSYVSRRYVPAGIEITDTAYWVETYRFNAQVEQYRQEVLSFQGQIDGLAETLEDDYVPFPNPDHYPKYGTANQVLSTLTNGKTRWVDPVIPDSATVGTYVDAWLDDHPEATTTVQDGSITPAKTTYQVCAYRGEITGTNDLNTYTDSGYYRITNATNLQNRPTDNIGTSGILIVCNPSDNGEFATQILVTITGSNRVVHHRILELLSHTSPSGWKIIGGTLQTELGNNQYLPISQKAVTDALNTGVLKDKGAVPNNGDFNAFTETGYYRVQMITGIQNKPDAPYGGTGVLICLKNTDSGDFTTQFLFTQTGASRWMHQRIINSDTEIPYNDWKLIAGTPLSAVSSSAYDASTVSQKALVDYINVDIMKDKGAIPNNGDLNDYVETGYYRIGNITNIQNKPTTWLGLTGVLICLKNTDSGDFTTQFLFTQSGNSKNIYARIIYKATGQPYFDWASIGATIATTVGSDPLGGIRPISQKAVNDTLNGMLTYKAQNIVIFGDSRTQFDGTTYPSNTKEEWRGRTCIGYQEAMKPIILTNNIGNEGVSGNNSIQIATRIEAANLSNYKAILIAGGVNDFMQASSITLGSIAPIGSTFDTSTVYGALQHAVEHLQTTYPALKIYMIVPAIAWIGGSIFPYTTAKIRKDIAELYNLPCLDLYKEAGITVINRDYFFADDPTLTNQWWVHFNDYGNDHIGKIIGKFLNNI